MIRTLRSWIFLAAAAAVVALTPVRPDAATPFVLQAGEHICIIGNQLAERMQYEGWLDTLLHARFPRHDLVIRNLGSRATRSRRASARRTSARPTSG